MAEDLSLRTCGKTGCRWPAAASLSYRYASRQVWILDLAAEPDPSLYDLCPHHADALTVPLGWDRVDERTHPAAVREPSGSELVGQPSPARSGAHGNRYAALVRELPRLAEQAQVQPRQGEQAEQAQEQRASSPPPVPSRELAPMPFGEDQQGPGVGQPAAAHDAASAPEQLAMPVEQRRGLDIGEAVVVAMEVTEERGSGGSGDAESRVE